MSTVSLCPPEQTREHCRTVMFRASPKSSCFRCPLGQGASQDIVPMAWCCISPFCLYLSLGSWALDTQAMAALTAVPCPAPAGGERDPSGEPVPAGTAAEEDGVQEPGGAEPAVPPPAAGRHAAPRALLWPGEGGLGAGRSRGCAAEREQHPLTLPLPSSPQPTSKWGCYTWVVVRPIWEELAGLGTLGTITLPSSA